MKIYRITKKKEYLNPEERKQIQDKFHDIDIQCTFAKDKDGYYCCTHRARSKSYPSISDIPRSAVDFISSTSSVGNEMIKIAVADGEFRDWKEKVNDLRDDIKDLKKDGKDAEDRIKKIEKTIEDLNIGNRRFWQMSNVFTSVQRKIERFDVLEQEWKKFKEEMDEEIKKIIEKKFKAQIK